MSTPDIAAVGFAAAALAAYHAWVRGAVNQAPYRSVAALISRCRYDWVLGIKAKNNHIVAVQGLRNQVMASSILASTSIVLLFGFVNFLSLTAIRSEMGESDNAGKLLGQLFGFVIDAKFGSKIIALLMLLGASFFCFAQAMRCFNHGATLISIPSPPAGYHDCNCPSCSSSADTLVSLEGERDEGFDALRHASDYQFIARLLNLAEAYHSFGIRCYYFSVLVVSYLWGPLALVACTFVLIGFLRIVDLDDLPMGES